MDSATRTDARRPLARLRPRLVSRPKISPLLNVLHCSSSKRLLRDGPGSKESEQEHRHDSVPSHLHLVRPRNMHNWNALLFTCSARVSRLPRPTWHDWPRCRFPRRTSFCDDEHILPVVYCNRVLSGWKQRSPACKLQGSASPPMPSRSRPMCMSKRHSAFLSKGCKCCLKSEPSATLISLAACLQKHDFAVIGKAGAMRLPCLLACLSQVVITWKADNNTH